MSLRSNLHLAESQSDITRRRRDLRSLCETLVREGAFVLSYNHAPSELGAITERVQFVPIGGSEDAKVEAMRKVTDTIQSAGFPSRQTTVRFERVFELASPRSMRSVERSYFAYQICKYVIAFLACVVVAASAARKLV